MNTTTLVQIRSKLTSCQSVASEMEDVAGSDLYNQLKRVYSGETFSLEELQLLQPSSETENYLHFKARASSIIGVSQQDIEAIFYMHNGKLELLMKTVLPDDWEFFQSYPMLPNYTNYSQSDSDGGNSSSFFYDFSFDTNPMTIVFSSWDFSNDQSPKEYLSKLDTSIDTTKIRKGLNFVSAISFSQIDFCDLFMDLFGIGDKNFPLYGYLTHDSNSQSETIVLEIGLSEFPFINKFNETFKNIFDGAFAVEIKSLVLSTGTSFHSGTGIGFTGSITIGGMIMNIELLWPIGSNQLIIKNTAPIDIRLESFVSLVKANKYLDDINTILDNKKQPALKIREFSMYLSFAPFSVPYVAISVGKDTGSASITLLKDIITIEDYLFKWEKDSAGSHFHFLSELKIGGGSVYASAEFPDCVFYGELGCNQSIALSDVIKEIFPNAGLPDISILDLSVNADVKNGLYTFEIDLASDWEIKLGSTSLLPLKNVRLSLEKSREEDCFATINSTMNIAGVDLFLMATNANSGGGWDFSGSTGPGEEIPVGKLIKYLAEKFHISQNVPKALESFIIENIAVEFNTQTKNFHFSCEAATEIEETLIDATLSIDITNDSNIKEIDSKENDTKEDNANGNAQQKEISYKKEIKCLLTIGNLQFEMLFDNNNESTSFIATYSHQNDNPVSLKDLVGHISSDQTLLDVLEGVKVDLKSILFAYYKENGTENSKTLFGLTLGTSINLSSLPLVGKVLPGNQTISIDNLRILVALKDINSEEMKFFNNVLNISKSNDVSSDMNHKKIEFTKGFHVTAQVNYGGNPPSLLSLPVTAQPSATSSDQLSASSDAITAIGKSQGVTQPGSGDAPTTTSNKPAAAESSSVVSSADGSSSSVKWFKIQKNLGPVHFERFGVQYKDRTLEFLLDAALSAAGLTLSLDGLSIRSPLDKFHPSFNLCGLGIDYRNGPVEIGGAFLRGEIVIKGADGKEKRFDEYSGMAVIRTTKFALSAFGSYADLDIGPSLFVYAVLSMPIGGPSFFFITGLAAAFGYNRTLLTPTVDKIADFPLVKMAINPPEGSVQKEGLSTIINELNQYIPPSKGGVFLAAGIKFTSFKLIDSFVLIIAKLGTPFELDIIGMSTAVIPTPEPGKSVSPIACIKMAILARFIPEKGFLGVEARLCPGSFILDKKCVLTGGFAFYLWFSGEHSGDFVISLGGYSPRFKKPDHYPVVPRINLSWQVNDNLSIKGDAYFALCPHVLMAGGHLEVTYQSGNIRAWLNAGADFLMSWKPFYYEARMHVNVGGSYTFRFIGWHTISIDVGADLALWGPDFSGTATVHLFIISFTISFGGSRPVRNPLDWKTFAGSFLPDKDKVCTVAIQKGLLRTVEEINNGKKSERWIIDPKNFVFATDSAIPVKIVKNKLEVGSVDSKKDSKGNSSDSAKGPSTTFGIGPMAISKDELNSDYEITILRGDQKIEDFSIFPITKNVPVSLWGEKLDPDINGPKFVEKVMCGFEIKPKNIAENIKDKCSLPASDLAYTITTVTGAFSWEEFKLPSLLDNQCKEQQAEMGVVQLFSHLEIIQESIQTQENRSRLLKGLLEHEDIK